MRRGRRPNGKLSYVDCLQTLNKYTTTLHCINSAIVKVGKLTHACVVYRGVSGGKLPDSFWVPDEFGCCGGVEPGFMSTTQSLAVATGYASSQLATAGMVIESVLGMTNRGADIGWLSQYPHEREILMPPLTCLEVEGTRAEGSLLVVKTKLSINLTSPTIERVIGKMKGSHLDLLRILHTKLAKVSPTVAQKLHGLEEEAAKLSVEFYNGAEAYKERTNLALDVKGRLEFEELDASLRSAAKFEFVFGSLEQLYANLSSVLSPPPDGASDEQLRQLMQAEHCEGLTITWPSRPRRPSRAASSTPLPRSSGIMWWIRRLSGSPLSHLHRPLWAPGILFLTRANSEVQGVVALSSAPWCR